MTRKGFAFWKNEMRRKIKALFWERSSEILFEMTKTFFKVCRFFFLMKQNTKNRIFQVKNLRPVLALTLIFFLLCFLRFLQNSFCVVCFFVFWLTNFVFGCLKTKGKQILCLWTCLLGFLGAIFELMSHAVILGRYDLDAFYY